MFGRRSDGSAAHPIARFGVRFLLCFMLVAAAWPFVVATYNRAIVACAGLVFSVVEEPNVTEIVARGDEVLVAREDPGREPRPFSVFTRYVYVGLVPLLALFLATPGIRWLRRCGLMGIGVLLLAAFHVVYVVLSIRLSYVSYGLTEVGAAQWYVYDWVQVLFRVAWDIIAVLIWAALTFRYWPLGRRASGPPPGGSTQEASKDQRVRSRTRGTHGRDARGGADLRPRS